MSIQLISLGVLPISQPHTSLIIIYTTKHICYFCSLSLSFSSKIHTYTHTVSYSAAESVS